MRRTFADNDTVGPSAAFLPLAQSSGREEAVAGVQAGVIGEQNGKSGFDGAVLVGVVQHDNFQGGKARHKFTDTMHPLFVDGNDCMGKFAVYLVRLVAYLAGVRVRCCRQEAFRMPFVAPAEYGGFMFRLKNGQNIFRMRSFPRTPHSQIADTDGRYADRRRTEDTFVKQEIPYADNQPVKQ